MVSSQSAPRAPHRFHHSVASRAAVLFTSGFSSCNVPSPPRTGTWSATTIAISTPAAHTSPARRRRSSLEHYINPTPRRIHLVCLSLKENNPLAHPGQAADRPIVSSMPRRACPRRDAVRWGDVVWVRHKECDTGMLCQTNNSLGCCFAKSGGWQGRGWLLGRCVGVEYMGHT